MEMHTEKDRITEILGEINTQLFDIGLLETVDNYLNSQSAYAVLEGDFATWIKTLRDFVAKMPEVVREEAGKVVDSIENTKANYRSAVYVAFKRNLSAALEVLADYVGIESTVKEIIANSALEEMWGNKLTVICQVLLEEADTHAKSDIMVEVLKVTEKLEDQMVLAEVLAEEPNINEILKGIDRQMMTTVIIDGIRGFDPDDDDDE